MVTSHILVIPERHTCEEALRGKSGVSHLLPLGLFFSVSSTDFLIWDHANPLYRARISLASNHRPSPTIYSQFPGLGDGNNDTGCWCLDLRMARPD